MFSFGGGEGHLFFIWGEVGHHILYLKYPPSLPRLKKDKLEVNLDILRFL